MPLRNLTIIMIAAVVSLFCYEKASRNRYANIVANAMELIDDNYVDQVERRDLFEDAMKGMVSSLDEYSTFIPPRSYDQFRQAIDQEFVGIGIVVEGPPQVEKITVVSPVFESPAYQAGIRAGDIIQKIGDQSTEEMLLEDAIDLIKGPQGSSVTLTVLHKGETEPVRMTIRRDVIRTRSVLGDRRNADGSWHYFLEQDPRIGYIRLTTFGEYSVSELRQVLVEEGGRMEGLILDLRGNAGGLLTTAVEAADMFLDRGLIVSTKGRRRRDQSEYHASPSQTIFDQQAPLVVLIDGYSASASEIVAACLKDHGRATIVGQRSWGKGTVQNIIALEGGRSALKLTTARYFRPNGLNIHRGKDATEDDVWGVKPTEGFEYVLSDEEYRKLFTLRRQLDVLGGDAVARDGEDWIEDEQLRMAREKIELDLQTRQPAAKRA